MTESGRQFVSARLKLGEKIVWRGQKEPVHGTVVSVYAPTNRASQGKKDEFYGGLQRTINDVAEQDILMIVGDVSRIGSRERQDIWTGVQGCHGWSHK